MKCSNIRFGKVLVKFFKNKKTKVIVKNSFSHEKLYEELFSIDEMIVYLMNMVFM